MAFVHDYTQHITKIPDRVRSPTRNTLYPTPSSLTSVVKQDFKKAGYI